MRFAKRIWKGIAGEDSRGGRDDISSAPDYVDRQANRAETSNAELGPELSLDMSTARVTGLLIIATLALTLVSFAVGLAGVLGGPFVRLFYVGADASLPSWYSALLLVLASLLLATVSFAVSAGGSTRYARRWAILAAIFAYLSCDEMLRLHERISNTVLQPGLEVLGIIPGGMLYYPWVIVYAPLVLIFVAAYFSFWRALPNRTRRLFLVASVIFVGGAIGVELFNAYHDEASGRELLVFIGTHIEELMEMVGIVVFVHALLSFLDSHLKIGALRISFGRPGAVDDIRDGTGAQEV